MEGSECLETCVEHWDTVPVRSQHLTNEVSQPPISLICKKVVLITPWILARRKFVQHRVQELLKSANRKIFWFT